MSYSNDKISGRRPVKLVAIAVVIVVVTVIVAFLVAMFLYNVGFGDKDDFDSPRILYATTIDDITISNISSIVSSGLDPSSKLEFERGDTVYVFYKFDNIIHNNSYSITEEIRLWHNGSLVDRYIANFSDSATGKVMFDTYNYETDDLSAIGNYSVEIDIFDKISDKNASTKFNFVLTKNNPDVLVLTTASKVSGYQDYISKSNFTIGDSVLVYTEYDDIETINDNTECDLYIKMDITANGEEVYSAKKNKTEVKNNAHYWNISTNGSWPVNRYFSVSLYLLDRLGDVSTYEATSFWLEEKTPEILVLTTASEVNGYQDYTVERYFIQGDTVHVYTEYTDILAVNDNAECDLYIEMNITADGKEYCSRELNKTEVKNNAHYWPVETDDTWPINTNYTVNFYLYDRNLLKSVSSEISFILL